MGESVKRKRVLIVEDEPHVATYLKTLLEDNGFAASTAPDGQRGLEMARLEVPDLVVLDLVMPGRSGAHLYRDLGEDVRLGAVPVIVVSAVAQLDPALSQPAAVFDKPIDPQAFIQTVERLLGRAD